MSNARKKRTQKSQTASLALATGSAGRISPLRKFLLMAAAQIGVALAMYAAGLVDSMTAIPACYFAICSAVVAAIISDKPARTCPTNH